MSWVTGIIVFLIMWWVVLFAVLPWGVQPEHDPEEGHMPGAPKKPMMVRKVIATTLVTAVLWLVAYWLISSDLISFRNP